MYGSRTHTNVTKGVKFLHKFLQNYHHLASIVELFDLLILIIYIGYIRIQLFGLRCLTVWMSFVFFSLHDF